MSLRSHVVYLVPEETERVAKAAFPRGNLYMQMRDAFGQIYDNQTFAPLFSNRGRPAEAPVRLALVTVMQFAEGLSDRQAADAVRSRIDWKYVLGLELTDPGFDNSVLSEFRTRLISGSAEHMVLDTLLTLFREQDLLKARGRQRTDSTHVLAAIRALNRFELVRETMRHALNSLAVAASDWLRTHAAHEWLERYDRRPEDDRLPTKQEQRQALAETIGHDGVALLTAMYAHDAPSWLRELPAVDILRRVWLQNYLQTAEGTRWRTTEDGLPPSAQFISSPHDLDAHYARKYTTQWVGYKVHLTETCEPDTPNLITHVETTPATTADGSVTPIVHEALHDKELLPETHIVDTGYLDAELLVASRRDYGVDLLGPTRPDLKWQAKEATGFAAQHFTINWEQQQATCPEGRTSISWTPAVDKRHNHVIKIKFSTKDCRWCARRSQCIRSQKKYPRRTITVRPQEQYQALQAAREREGIPAYTRTFAKRAGIEGTISQGVRRCGLRRSRYIGQAKTHLQHVLTAAAINFVRVAEWLTGTPRAQTRHSPFAVVMAQL